MQIKNIMKSLVLSMLLLCGCSSLWVRTVPEDKPNLNISNPEPLELSSVQLRIIKKDNIDSVFKDLDAKGLKQVAICLSGNDYKILSLDINKIDNYIKLLQEVLKQYRDYYEGQ